MGTVIESIGLFDNSNGRKTTSLELIGIAANKCLGNCPTSRDEIDLVINCSLYRDDYFGEPAFATFVQRHLDINLLSERFSFPSTLSFDVLNGALGFFNACQVASSFISVGKAKRAFILSGDVTDIPIDEHGDEENYWRSGAAMILVNDTKAWGFGRFFIESYPELADAMRSYSYFSKDGFKMFYKRDSGIEELLSEAIVTTVGRLNTKHQLNLDDFDFIVPPQISPEFIFKISERLELEISKVVDVTKRGKDLFNASIPRAMSKLLDNQEVKPGQKALIISAGSGIQVGCTTYRF